MTTRNYRGTDAQGAYHISATSCLDMTYNTQSTDLGLRKTFYIVEEIHPFAKTFLYSKKMPPWRKIFKEISPFCRKYFIKLMSHLLLRSVFIIQQISPFLWRNFFLY